MHPSTASHMRPDGLTSEQVQEQIAKGLQNVASRTRTRRVTEILLENLFSVFNLIIFGVVLVLMFFYFRTGDDRLLLDSVGTLTVAFLNTTLAIVQEVRAKRALDRVNLLLERKVHVVRDGHEVEIDQSDIVAGDLIRLERGDQVVVDGRVVQSNHLEIDESLLTGESVPIFKNPHDDVMSGSFCVSGNGYYVAVKVGDESYAAEVTTLAKQFKLVLTPLQKRLNAIVKILFGVAVVLVTLKLIVGPRPGTEGNDFVRELVTIVLSLVPQGLVLMASVTFALGVYRISRLGAIVQKLNAIESFANVRVVCMDKTGTLTKNHLSVHCLTLLDDGGDFAEAEALLGAYGLLSSDKNATLRTLEGFAVKDGWRLLDEIPFSSEKKMSLINVEAGGREEAYILGAFDVLVDRVTVTLRERAGRVYEERQLSVYRNLLFGRVAPGVPFTALRDSAADFEIEPVCIVSITDEVRDDVMQAIKLFQANGIEFKILSGDAPEAIRAVVREIGWQLGEDKAITGQELDRVAESDFTGVITEKAVFARLRPDHKLRIIKALRGQKVYTVMIGDGVNDLPAIKEADLGIAMEEGSKITKEVADIVLLKNRFALLPAIFDEGNRIVNTVGSVAKLFLTKNFLVINYTLLALFALFNFPLTPRRIALVNVFTIGLPSFVIALRNNNVSRATRLLPDLFSFVIISSLFIAGASLVGERVMREYYRMNEGDLQMALLCIVIFTSIANFFAVALHRGEAGVRFYAIYGVSLLAVFTFLATTRLDFFILDMLRLFYEITHLDARYWGALAAIGLGSAALLFVAQKLREKFIYG